MIRLETRFTKRFITDNGLNSLYQRRISRIVRKLKRGNAIGSEMTGWIKYVQNYDRKELRQMVSVARKWNRRKIKKIVVIGIGGSYLGIKAGLDMLNYKLTGKGYQVYFAHNFNQNYLTNMLKSIGKSPFGIIIISKSGTTLEPAIAFSLFRKRLFRNVGKKKASKLIVTITDKERGEFAAASKEYGWPKFVIPRNIGGRYSALTPAGMFLFILLGLDYKAIIKGAKDASIALMNPDLTKNDAFRYACYRNYFRSFHRYEVENFAVYDPSLVMFSQVWKQLFGESEGKNHKALYPTTSLFTTDLHSIGQYLQEGTRNFFETTLYIKKPVDDVRLSMKFKNFKYLNNKKLSYVNEVAMLSTINAHYQEGKTKNLIIYVDKQDPYHFGYLYMWMCFAAMASAYLLRLNPFDQPGVEVYKRRIASILKNK